MSYHFGMTFKRHEIIERSSQYIVLIMLKLYLYTYYTNYGQPVNFVFRQIRYLTMA